MLLSSWKIVYGLSSRIDKWSSRMRKVAGSTAGIGSQPGSNDLYLHASGAQGVLPCNEGGGGNGQ